MAMIRRATSGKIENVADSEDKTTGVIVCKACSHVVFRVNLGSNGNCPYCHRDASKSIERVDIPDSDYPEDDEDDIVAIKC